MKKVKKKISKIASQNVYNIDWCELDTIIDRTVDFLINEGLYFDFNDPAVRNLFMMDIERVILKLERGEKVELLGIIEMNRIDNGIEIIDELRDFKRVLDSEIYREVLEKTLSKSEKGRPPFDQVLLFNCLILQSLYDYSDDKIAKWIKTPAFKWFLDFPENYPKSSTIRAFREKLKDENLLNEIWNVHITPILLKNIFSFDNFNIYAQDATFIHCNQGSYLAPRGDKARTRRSRDGTSSKKGNEWHFGYKLHQVMDLKSQLIIFFDTTTASVHDSKIIFETMNCIVYGDKGYFGVDFKGYKGFMMRQSNDSVVNARRTQRNKRISSKRAPVERPFATLEQIGADKVKVTTVERVNVKMLMALIIHNTKQLITLEKQEKEVSEEVEYKIEEYHDVEFTLEFFNQIPKRIKLQNTIEKIKKINHKYHKYRKRPKILVKNIVENKKNKSSNSVKTNRKLDYSF